MHRSHTLIASAVIWAAAGFGTACAHPGSRQYAAVPFSSDLLTWSELTAEPHLNAYSAVERLRPLFLRVRPGVGDVRGEAQTISVFIDGDFAGDQDVLRTIPVREIESIRRVQPAMAYATMGSLHLGNEVLLVRLRCHVAC